MIVIKTKKIKKSLLLNSIIAMAAFSPIVIANNVEATSDNVTLADEQVNEIYIDPLYKGQSDGTTEKPFKTLEEALSNIGKDKYKNTRAIFLKNDIVISQEENYKLDFSNINNRFSLNGQGHTLTIRGVDLEINGASYLHSNFITIENLNISMLKDGPSHQPKIIANNFPVLVFNNVTTKVSNGQENERPELHIKEGNWFNLIGQKESIFKKIVIPKTEHDTGGAVTISGPANSLEGIELLDHTREIFINNENISNFVGPKNVEDRPTVDNYFEDLSSTHLLISPLEDKVSLKPFNIKDFNFVIFNRIISERPDNEPFNRQKFEEFLSEKIYASNTLENINKLAINVNLNHSDNLSVNKELLGAGILNLPLRENALVSPLINSNVYGEEYPPLRINFKAEGNIDDLIDKTIIKTDSDNLNVSLDREGYRLEKTDDGWVLKKDLPETLVVEIYHNQNDDDVFDDDEFVDTIDVTNPKTYKEEAERIALERNKKLSTIFVEEGTITKLMILLTDKTTEDVQPTDNTHEVVTDKDEKIEEDNPTEIDNSENSDDFTGDDNHNVSPTEDNPVVDKPAEDNPIVDTPTEDNPAVDTPTEDNPIVDTPTEDNPAVDTPTEDNPIVDTPTEDNPAVDTPTEDNPIVDTPTEDSPVVDTPTEDNPTVDTPTEDNPTVDTPTEDSPVGDKPTEDNPVVDTPTEDNPVVDKPTEDNPVVDKPTEDNPTVDKPKEDNPTVDKPKEDNPTVDKPKEDNPTVDKPKEDNPVVDKPKEDNPTVDKPKEDNPVVDKPTEDNPAVNKPTKDNTIVDKPKEDKPIVNKSTIEDLKDENNKMTESKLENTISNKKDSQNELPKTGTETVGFSLLSSLSVFFSALFFKKKNK